MNLGDLITALEAADPQQVVAHGFGNPHSYRGDYMELAFEPVDGTTVRDMLIAARSAVYATFQGYKGGDFVMTPDTWCWLSEHGDASGESISPQMLAWMLSAAPAAVGGVVSAAPTQTDDRDAVRDRIADVLAEADGWQWVTGRDKARSSTYRSYQSRAAAVLAVLPPPADRGALERVRALHLPKPDGSGFPNSLQCRSCSYDGGDGYQYLVPWPCPTVEAVDEELRRVADEAQPQPDTETRKAEAHPPHHRWYTETLDNAVDEWAPGMRFTNRAEAVARYETVSRNHPLWKDGSPVARRFVRETTSYTVEEPGVSGPRAADNEPPLHGESIAHIAGCHDKARQRGDA